jgi:hypothetical protein
MQKILCEPYIWEDIQATLKVTLLPPRHSCVSELTNVIVVSYVVGTLLSLFFIDFAIYILAVVTLLLIPSFVAYGDAMRPYDSPYPKPEGFQMPSTPHMEIPATVTYPTDRNPFMNVLINEIKYNPTRPPAADISSEGVKISLDDFFRVEFTSDPTDVFGRSQSQRQFITMPSTTVPNDQDSYQNWLYKIPGKTCKEGGREACLPGTDGGALPWLNVER